jgi:hypothetical protein
MGEDVRAAFLLAENFKRASMRFLFDLPYFSFTTSRGFDAILSLVSVEGGVCSPL